MCGISGVFYFNQRNQLQQPQLNEMMELIVHRGPDQAGIYNDEGVFLGFRRLSIIDIEEGAQPIANSDNSARVVFNGEIYNYKQLRSMLESEYTFKTNSDTEVIIHLYDKYGEDCVHHLRGMFAFVIWDSKRQRLFVARDHFGIKPFYYYHDHEKLVFGSEIKSILLFPGVERSVHRGSLINYLSFQYVPTESTMFAGIQKLSHAHSMMIARDGNLKLKQYWDPQFEPQERSLTDYIEEIRERLRDSVAHHMQSDVQRGCFLSSGIDSTAIAALMRERESIKTFSVGFEGENNEAVISTDTALQLGTEHFARMISESDFFDVLPATIWHQDEPVADPSAVALYHVAQLAKKHVTVVLSGEGADELFGGYRIYKEPNALRPLSWLPESLKSPFKRLVGALPENMYGRNYLDRAMTPIEQRFLGNAKVFIGTEIGEILSDSMRSNLNGHDPFSVVAPFYEKTKNWDPVSRMQYIDLHFWMPGDILMKADKMTMAHSLELRVPFLDKELFELVRRIPVKHRVNEKTTKIIFRKAMEGIVPDKIVGRPKLGFPVPLEGWLRGPRADQLLEVIKSADIAPYFNMAEVEKMVRKQKNNEGKFARKLWVLYVFAMWHSTFIQTDRWREHLIATRESEKITHV